MKEIIYLDTEMINSYLAQMDEGLINQITTSLSTGSQESSGSESRTAVSTTGGGSAGVVKGNISLGDEQNLKEGAVYSKQNSELIETAIDDYSLDLIIERLEEDETLNYTTESIEDGQFILLSDNFKTYDFKRLSEVTAQDTLNLITTHSEEILKKQDKLDKLKKRKDKKKLKNEIDRIKEDIKRLEEDSKGMENYKNVYRLGAFGETLFPGSCLFKIGDLLAICPKSNLRIDESTLGILNLTERKLKVLGTIISKRRNLQPESDAEGHVIQLESDIIASLTPSMFMDIMLNSFHLSEKDDYLIRPMAIYFD